MTRESSSSGLRSVRGGVTPRTGFRGIYQDWVMLHMWFLFEQDAPRMGLNLEQPIISGPGPTIIILREHEIIPITIYIGAYLLKYQEFVGELASMCNWISNLFMSKMFGSTPYFI